MKICIDGLGITHLRNTGIGTCTYQLIKGLLNLYPQPKYELLWNNCTETFEIELNNKVSLLNLDIDRPKSNFINVENFITNNKVDIYHSPNNGFSIPKNKVCNYFMTVHDLLPVINRNYVDEKYLDKFLTIFPDSLEKCDKIIVPSQYYKEVIKSFFNIPDKKLEVIYPSCSDIFTAKNTECCENILKSKYRIEGDYILYAGSIHKRKNLDKLIYAFKDIKDTCPSLKLVVVGNYSGKRIEYYNNLLLLVEKLNLKNSVFFVGEADFNDMPYFYTKARCVVNLSKYDGFPLTTIEALSCNAPVVCNNLSVFKEVLGDLHCLIDVNDHENLVDGILSALFNNKFKENLNDKLPSILNKFTLQNNIKRTIKLYESTYN